MMLSIVFLFLMIRPRPRSTLCPYTTLFRSGMRDRLGGDVKFIFQPAEEGGGGGKVMVDEGVADDASTIFALHLWPGLPFGDRKSTRLNSSHANISYAVFCLKKINTIRASTY